MVTEGEAVPVAEEAKPKECLWMKMGMVAHRICTNDYNCITCEFGQMMEDALQQKLAKLTTRREALRKKKQKAGARA